MNIEITKPEVEALIQQRLLAGGFSTPEDMIFQALRAFENKPPQQPIEGGSKFKNLSDLLLNSPFAGADLDLERSRDLPRDIDIR
jgi:hypothetical protein